VIDFTNEIIALDASDSTNGSVTVVLDLVAGGYAGLDNFLIVASDTAGDVGVDPVVPDPIAPNPAIPSPIDPIDPVVDLPSETPATPDPNILPTPTAAAAGFGMLALIGRRKRRM